MTSGLKLDLSLGLSPTLKAALLATLAATALVAAWSALSEPESDATPMQDSMNPPSRSDRAQAMLPPSLPQPQRPPPSPSPSPSPSSFPTHRAAPWPALNPAAAAAWAGPHQPAAAAVATAPPPGQANAKTSAVALAATSAAGQGASGAAIAAGAASANALMPPFAYTLIGVLQQAGVHTALLEGPQRSLAVRSPDLIDGQWQVLQVAPDAMELLFVPAQKRVRVAYAQP